MQSGSMSNRKCSDCVYYIQDYQDKFKNMIRPACNYALCGGYIDHNPAPHCNNFKYKSGDKEKLYKIEKYCRENRHSGLVDIDGIMDIIKELTNDND